MSSITHTLRRLAGQRGPSTGAGLDADEAGHLWGAVLDGGVPDFAGAWLRHRHLDWAADLLTSFPGLASGSLRTANHPQENLL